MYRCYGNERKLSSCLTLSSSRCQRNHDRNYFRSIILYCGGDIGKYIELSLQNCKLNIMVNLDGYLFLVANFSSTHQLIIDLFLS